MDIDLSSPKLLRIWSELLGTPPVFPGSASLPREMQYLVGCRNHSQFLNTLRGLLSPKTHCPFCHPVELCEKGLIDTTENFYLKENDFPRSDSEMFLIIPRRHIVDYCEIPQSAWGEILQLITSAMDCEISAQGASLLLRFGNPTHHVGTIEHLHFNLVSPKSNNTVLLPVGKTEVLWEEDYVRVHAWLLELSQNGGLEKLFSEA